MSITGNVKSLQELASVEKTKLQEIVDDPLLLNTVFPVLSKFAFPITMANDPCKKAKALLKKHAGKDTKVDPLPNVQDGVQSDAFSTHLESYRKGPDTESLHQSDASLTTSTVETPEQRGNRRKVKLNPCLIQLKDFTFSTSSLRIGEEPEYWPNDETVTKVAQHRFKMDSIDDNIYPVQPWNNNQALLINITEFDSIEDLSRQGAEVDDTQLQSVLEQLGFEVTLCLNKKKVEIEHSVKEYWVKLQSKNPSMSLVFIGSHGEGLDNDDRFLSYDRIPMRVSSIIDELSGKKCPCLAGKPQIFLFQFCRQNERNSVVAGTEITVHRDQNRVHHDETNEAEVNTLPPFARSKVDMLQAYATAAGTKAYRDVKEGSWFVTALCKVLKEQAHSEDLLSMLTKVNNMVKTTANMESNQVAVQLCEFSHTMTKKLRFYPQ